VGSWGVGSDLRIVQGCNGDGAKACKELIGHSLRLWRAEEEVVDDITAVVVYFHKY
jgi:hypothetical protein